MIQRAVTSLICCLVAACSSDSSAAGQATAGTGAGLSPFSFFVTSFAAISRLSGSADGFGGDLRYGQADGLAGADTICAQIAEASMPGSGAKGFRAFLSATRDASGNPVHAIDRIGEGPWYDRLGRVFAMSKADLLFERPRGAHEVIVNDFPNEDGVPNHDPDGTGVVDNHDMLTGTNAQGQLYSSDWSSTCHDWTSAVGSDGRPRVGHSWPRSGRPGGRNNGVNWMSSLDEAGCGPGATLEELGGPIRSNPTVGSGGGYGGFYCFAVTP
jgi:hypothetical protein